MVITPHLKGPVVELELLEGQNRDFLVTQPRPISRHGGISGGGRRWIISSFGHVASVSQIYSDSVEGLGQASSELLVDDFRNPIFHPSPICRYTVFDPETYTQHVPRSQLLGFQKDSDSVVYIEQATDRPEIDLGGAKIAILIPL